MSDAAPVDEEDIQPAVTDADQIDWGALWEEFGFDTPDADGSMAISETQLTLALEASEQDIGGTYRQHVRDAVEAGTLAVKTRTAADSAAGNVTLGYIWEGLL